MSPTTTLPTPRRLPVVEGLMSCLEQRGLAGHSERVAALAGAVCARMQLSAKPAEVVVTAALLHDVGKLAIPTSLLDRPGDLLPHEFEIMRSHVTVGAKTLEHVASLRGEAQLVRHSHERWDGWGYPDGLAGGLIPLGSRIIAACDAWDAMTSDRPYRSARSFDEALEVLLTGAGAQFDVDVVAVLVTHLSSTRSA